MESATRLVARERSLGFRLVGVLLYSFYGALGSSGNNCAHRGRRGARLARSEPESYPGYVSKASDAASRDASAAKCRSHFLTSPLVLVGFLLVHFASATFTVIVDRTSGTFGLTPLSSSNRRAEQQAADRIAAFLDLGAAEEVVEGQLDATA